MPPRKATVGLTPKWRPATPRMAVAAAKRTALRFEIRPRTSGRLRVRDIFASCSGSRAMLRVFAEAAHKAVPEVRKTRVRAERDGEVVVVERRRDGVG